MGHAPFHFMLREEDFKITWTTHRLTGAGMGVFLVLSTRKPRGHSKEVRRDGQISRDWRGFKGNGFIWIKEPHFRANSNARYL